MLEWLRAGGAQLPALAARHDTASGWGVVALEALPAGARIMCIPGHFLITLQVSDTRRRWCHCYF
jgi:hypothetical protein